MGKRIRVAHIITNFAAGGAQGYLLAILEGLDKAVFEPMVFGRMEGELVDVFNNIKGVKVYDVKSLRRNISPLNDIRAVGEIRKLCLRNQVDIAHTHSSKAGILGRISARQADVKTVVHTVHGFSFNDFMAPPERKLLISFERWMSSYTTYLLFVSQKEKVLGERLRIGARKECVTIYNGIDYKPYLNNKDRKEVRAVLGLSNDDYVVGFTGRLSKQKGLHILIEAFARFQSEVQSARLLLVGDGPLRRSLKERATKLGVSTKLVITGLRDDVPDLLHAMDLFVMTSFWEGLSRSLAEAMYAKVPVVATDVGGTTDAVETGKTGWLVEPNNVEQVVNAMREAYAFKEKSRAMADAAHDWAIDAFSLTKMIEAITKLYLSSSEELNGKYSTTPSTIRTEQ